MLPEKVKRSHQEVRRVGDLLPATVPLHLRGGVADDATVEAHFLTLAGFDVLQQLGELGRHAVGGDCRSRGVAQLTESCGEKGTC